MSFHISVFSVRTWRNEEIYIEGLPEYPTTLTAWSFPTPNGPRMLRQLAGHHPSESTHASSSAAKRWGRGGPMPSSNLELRCVAGYLCFFLIISLKIQAQMLCVWCFLLGGMGVYMFFPFIPWKFGVSIFELVNRCCDPNALCHANKIVANQRIYSTCVFQLMCCRQAVDLERRS